MYKAKLQELCQQRRWKFPQYSTIKEGPDHQPIFSASIKVKDEVFLIPAKCRSSKEAQNAVAQVAFEHFTVPAPIPDPVAPEESTMAVTQAIHQEAAIPEVSSVSSPQSSVPVSQSGLSAAGSDAIMEPANIEVLQQTCEDSQQVHIVYRTSVNVLDVNDKDTLHLCKHSLRQYAEKKCLGLPTYFHVKEGLHHDPYFKSIVTLDEISYETVEFFPTLNEADQAVSMVACQYLGVDVFEENAGFDTIKGEVAKSKNQVELNAAAKVDYCALTKKFSVIMNTRDVVDNSTQNTRDAVKYKHYKDSVEKEVERSAEKDKSSPTNVIENADCSSSLSTAFVVSPRLLRL